MLKNKSFERIKGPKQQIRELLCRYSPLAKTILTLPSRKGLCVKTFRRLLNKPVIIGVERDKEIVNEIRENLNITCYHSDLTDYINTQIISTNHFDICFLDYYSNLTNNVMDNIKALIKNDNVIHLGKQCILGITVSKGLRQDGKDILNQMDETIFRFNNDPITNTLENTSSLIAHSLIEEMFNYKFNIEILESMEYNAKNGSSTMYFMCFKITK